MFEFGGNLGGYDEVKGQTIHGEQTTRAEELKTKREHRASLR